MTVTVIASREARTQWRDMLDKVYSGANDVVIERYGKPVAVLIPYEDFEALSEFLEDLRLGRMASKAYEEWKKDPSTAVPYSEFREELIADGWLDE
jgi:prevent-host-death family protein